MIFPQKPQPGQPVRAELIGQIIDCLRMNRPLPGRNVTTDCTPGGTIINGTPGGTAATTGSRLTPWTIRHHKTEGDEEGQFEIYLPSGCMSVGGTLENLNKAASETSGHDGDGEGVEPDPPDWRILPIKADEGPEDPDPGISQGTTRRFRRFDVVAHAKTAARLDGVDGWEKPAKRYLWVNCERTLSAAAASAPQYWGDEFAQTVARIEIGTEYKVDESGTQAKAYSKVTQFVNSQISVAGRPRTGFDLEWVFHFDETGALKVKNVYCVRQLASAAGLSLTGATMTDVSSVGETSIYAMIKTNPLDPENESPVEVVKKTNEPTSRDDFVTWLRLYDIADNTVRYDYRSQSLVNIQVYR